jgi:hypothetical protein
MSTLLRVLSLLVSSALFLAPVACDLGGKDEASGEEGKKKKKKKKGDDGDEEEEDDEEESRGLADDGKKKGKKDAPAPAPAPAASGAILEYMPADCPGGRMYADFSALLSDPAAQNILREISLKLLAKERDPETQKAVEVLKRSGFDLATGIREVVACMKGQDDYVFGVALSVADPLKLLGDLVTAVGQPALTVSDRNGAKVVEMPQGALIQPAPGLLLMAQTQRVGEVTAKAGGNGFASARGQVAYLGMMKDGGLIEAKISRAGESFNLWGAIQFTGQQAENLKKDPEAMERELRNGALKEAAELKNTPFAMLEQRVQNATFKVQGDRVVANLSLPVSDLTTLLKIAAPQLGVTVTGEGSPGPSPSPGPAPAPVPQGEQVDPLDELLKMMKKRNG